MDKPDLLHGSSPHSPAWVAQAWVSFIAATAFTAIGIAYLPVDPWMRGFLGMGLLFSVGSAVGLAKTLRDLHESNRLSARIDEVRLHKIFAEHNPLP